MKFVIDTNILFSAIIRKSITRKVILSDVFELYVPEYLFEEINKVYATKEILELLRW